MNQILRNKINFTFPKPLIFIGILTIISSVFIVFEYPLTAFILFIIGFFLSTNSYGSEISLNHGLYRGYNNFFGFKIGKWNQLSSMSSLAVLRSQDGYTAFSTSNRSTTLNVKKYDVCLLNDTHRDRFVIQKFNTEDEALRYSNFLSKLLKIDFTVFNPKISEKTLTRRSRNRN